MAQSITNEQRLFWEKFLRDHPIDPAYDYVEDMLDAEGEELDQQFARDAKKILEEAAQFPAI